MQDICFIIQLIDDIETFTEFIAENLEELLLSPRYSKCVYRMISVEYTRQMLMIIIIIIIIADIIIARLSRIIVSLFRHGLMLLWFEN